jgi:hypothetical protein
VAVLGFVFAPMDGGSARLEVRGTCIVHDRGLSSSLFPSIQSTCVLVMKTA